MCIVCNFTCFKLYFTFVVQQWTSKCKILACFNSILDFICFSSNVCWHVSKRCHFYTTVIHMPKVVTCFPSSIHYFANTLYIVRTPVVNSCSQLCFRSKLDLITCLTKPQLAFCLCSLQWSRTISMLCNHVTTFSHHNFCCL